MLEVYSIQRYKTIKKKNLKLSQTGTQGYNLVFFVYQTARLVEFYQATMICKFAGLLG